MVSIEFVVVKSSGGYRSRCEEHGASMLTWNNDWFEPKQPPQLKPNTTFVGPVHMMMHVEVLQLTCAQRKTPQRARDAFGWSEADRDMTGQPGPEHANLECRSGACFGPERGLVTCFASKCLQTIVQPVWEKQMQEIFEQHRLSGRQPTLPDQPTNTTIPNRYQERKSPLDRRMETEMEYGSFQQRLHPGFERQGGPATPW